MFDEEKATIANASPANAKFAPSFIKSIAQGAATTIWCATSPELNNIGSVYCADGDISPIVDNDSFQTNGVRNWAIDTSMAERLWTLSEKSVGFDWTK